MCRIPMLVLALLVPAFSFAEEPSPATPAKRWTGSAEGTLVLTSGNTSIRTIGLGAEAQFKPDPWAARARTAYLNSTDSGAPKAESFSAELRAERLVTGDLSAFSQALYLINRFAGFNNRVGGDLGVVYHLYHDDIHLFTTEAGLGVLREDRTNGISTTFGTARVGAEYRWKLSSTSELSLGLSFLDNLGTMRDWRVVNTNALTVVLTSLLSLRVGFRVEHMNFPVTGKKATDTATTLALVAKL